MIEDIVIADTLCALLIRKEAKFQKTNFFTSEDEALQLGVFVYNEQHNIPLHKHNRIPRTIQQTQEVILCKEGEMICRVYKEPNGVSRSLKLREGDIIYFISGWHEFDIEFNCIFIEIKNGPYIGDKDKTRYNKCQ